MASKKANELVIRLEKLKQKYVKANLKAIELGNKYLKLVG